MTKDQKIEWLKAALAPFAAKATAWEGRHQVDVGGYVYSNSTQISHRLGDFRAARDVLTGIQRC